MGDTDKVTIAEARARRSDPAWRRRHQLTDLRGIVLVGLLLIVPPVGGILWRPLGVAAAAAILIGAPAGLWWRGPVVGLERRTAVLAAVPVLNLVVLVPALWRLAHLGIQHWQGPLQPDLDDGAWVAAAALGIVCWLGAAALLVLSLT